MREAKGQIVILMADNINLPIPYMMSMFNPTHVGMLSASETSHNQGYTSVERSSVRCFLFFPLLMLMVFGSCTFWEEEEFDCLDLHSESLLELEIQELEGGSLLIEEDIQMLIALYEEKVNQIAFMCQQLIHLGEEGKISNKALFQLQDCLLTEEASLTQKMLKAMKLIQHHCDSTND